MNHLGTVEIESKRLLLRKFTKEDIVPAYKNWTSDDSVTKFLRWPTHSSIDITMNVLTDWIESYKKADFYQWAIILKEYANEPIGTISVVDKNEELDILHIGYCIGSKWWNRGITSEALESIIPYLFDKVKANRIESQHDPKNSNSGKVMLKCGLKYEGTLREADVSNQGIVDAAIYSILASEYYSI